nr:MAG TPA: hypothetical protein [Caudoviricetes sp.]DAY17973.1 MAG TPA: hypothetical protein [Caudoviricetes sp.]
MLDMSKHINNKAQWVKGEFDDMVEAGFPASQLYRDTVETISFVGGKLGAATGKVMFYYFPDGTKLKITSSPSISCEVIE